MVVLILDGLAKERCTNGEDGPTGGGPLRMNSIDVPDCPDMSVLEALGDSFR